MRKEFPDELYPFDITGLFDYIEINEDGRVINTVINTKTQIFNNISNLEEILTLESYINLKAYISKIDSFFCMKFNFKSENQEESKALVFENKNGNYSLIILPTEERIEKIMELFDAKIEQRKDYSEEVFHDIKSNLSTISIKLNDLETKIELENDSDFIELKKHVNELSKSINDLCYFIIIEKEAPYKKKTKWRDIIYDAISESCSIWEEYPKPELKLIIKYRNKEYFNDHPVGLSPYHIEKIDAENVLNSMLMTRAVKNVFENSIKYSRGEKKPIITISIQDKESVFSIYDNGIGIRKVDRNKIAKRGFRAPISFVQNTPGLGLGLSIVKDILKEHEMDLFIDSKQNQYTIIEFRMKK